MHALLHSVPPTLQQATTDPHLLWRLLDTPGQVWVSVLWDHGSFLLGPGAHKVLFVPSKSLFAQSCVSSGGSMVGLMAISSKRAYAIPRSTAPRVPVPAAVQCWPIPRQDGFSLEIIIIKYFRTYLESIKIRAFPGDPLVKNPPCKAGDTVSIPGQETKIPMLWNNKACMPQLQSPCAATKDPTWQQRAFMPQLRSNVAK